MRKLDLARGPRQVIIIPDETRMDVEREDWTVVGRNLRFARIDVPTGGAVHRYRLVATIAMAEIDRQVGGRARRTAQSLHRPARLRPRPRAG